MKSSASSTRLIVASSESSADMLYATGFHAPDPFIYLRKDGKTTIVLNDLEIDRGHREAKVDEIVAYSDIVAKLATAGIKSASFGDVLTRFLKERRARTALVPSDFPLGLARSLPVDIRLQPVEGSFWKEREQKTADELNHLRKALKITEAGILRGIEVLAASEIGRANVLRWAGRALTSETLRAEIDMAVLRAGGRPGGTIVAGGNQACDPHERGSGQLRANSLIILDVFPRSAKTGFFGDLTRTVARGRANESQRDLWETTREGQALALRKMRPGGDGKVLQDEVRDFFTAEGFPTEKRNGRWSGFFHGLGHGLGLEIHEEPRVGKTTFKPGRVLTVEPGLYCEGIGGARIEDVVTITETGIRKLSNLPIMLEV